MRRLGITHDTDDEPVVTFRPFTPSDTDINKQRDVHGSLTSTLKSESPPDLRSRLKSLRDQQRLTEEVHAMQLDRLRDDYEARLAQHLAASEDIFHQLEASEQALSEEQAKAQRYQLELQALKSAHQREISDLQDHIQSLRREIGTLQASQRTAFASDISALQLQAQTRYEALEQDYLQIKSQRDDSVAALKASESEGKRLKNALDDLRRESDSEMRRLQEQVLGLRKEIRNKGQEVEDLRRFQQRQDVHSDVKAREATALEVENTSLRAHNLELEAQVARLEKLVFGKSSRRL